VRYDVRTPSNYDGTIVHPLLIVYAAAGQTGRMSERLTGLTPLATRAGFVAVYADHRPLGVAAIEQLGTIPGSVAQKWCIDERRVFATGHSDGGTAALALAVLEPTKHRPDGIAPSAAGWTGKDLEAYRCPAPMPVMIMHSANDRLFPGWGGQTAAWWAACNRCDSGMTKKVEGGCLAFQHCAPGGATMYCEGTGGHREWPNLNRVMLEFFARPETVQ
jgi:polyhydroxybutyrate depolymerase